MKCCYKEISILTAQFIELVCKTNYPCRNSRASVWSPLKSKRFKTENSSAMDNPPPGTYNPSDMDSQNGSYILSNFKTLGIKKFVPIQRN